MAIGCADGVSNAARVRGIGAVEGPEATAVVVNDEISDDVSNVACCQVDNAPGVCTALIMAALTP